MRFRDSSQELYSEIESSETYYNAAEKGLNTGTYLEIMLQRPYKGTRTRQL